MVWEIVVIEEGDIYIQWMQCNVLMYDIGIFVDYGGQVVVLDVFFVEVVWGDVGMCMFFVNECEYFWVWCVVVWFIWIVIEIVFVFLVELVVFVQVVGNVDVVCMWIVCGGVVFVGGLVNVVIGQVYYLIWFYGKIEVVYCGIDFIG